MSGVKNQSCNISMSFLMKVVNRKIDYDQLVRDKTTGYRRVSFLKFSWQIQIITILG